MAESFGKGNGFLGTGYPQVPWKWKTDFLEVESDIDQKVQGEAEAVMGKAMLSSNLWVLVLTGGVT